MVDYDEWVRAHPWAATWNVANDVEQEEEF